MLKHKEKQTTKISKQTSHPTIILAIRTNLTTKDKIRLFLITEDRSFRIIEDRLYRIAESRPFRITEDLPYRISCWSKKNFNNLVMKSINRKIRQIFKICWIGFRKTT